MTALFTYAFRPLFLLATFYAIVVVPFWVAAWLGANSMPISLGSPLWWHAHEMIYGFAGAAVGGFALTAVATWTKRPPVTGVPLIVLSVLWLAARVLFLSPSFGVRIFAISADLAYGAMLFLLMSREVIGARNQRNYKVLLILALLPVTNALFFVGLVRRTQWTGATLLAGLWLVILLINLIGGRVIPTFTGNWLRRHATEAPAPGTLPPAFGRLDLLATWLLVAFAALDVGGAPPFWTAALGGATGALLLVRLHRWQGRRALREPLVWVLHLGFAWIPIGVLFLSAGALGLLPRSAGVHALTAGAMTTMIVAIASRAALGHTGRPLRSHPLMTVSYVFITIAALSRVTAAAGWGARLMLMVSATTWTLGFACFAWRFAPILTRPRQTSARSLPIV